MGHLSAMLAAFLVITSGCLFAEAPAGTPPADRVEMAIPPQVRALAGKVVRIDFDVDVDGRGPSAIGTRYLVDLLIAAGAKPLVRMNSARLDSELQKVQVLIVGDIRPELTHARNPDDPMEVEGAAKLNALLENYPQLVAQRKAEAAGAKARFISGADVRSALGLNITHAHLLSESYHSMCRVGATSLPQVKFDKNVLADVLDFLKDVSGTPIDADWAALSAVAIQPDRPITFSENDVSLLKVLQAICAACDNKVAIISDGARIRLTSADDAKRRLSTKNSIWFGPDQWAMVQLPPQPPLIGPLAALVKSIPTAHFDAIGLETALSFLKDVGGVSIAADWPALRSIGISTDTPITMKCDDLTLGQVLDECAQTLSSGRAAFYATSDGVIHLTTTAKAEAAVKESGGKQSSSNPVQRGKRYCRAARPSTPYGLLREMLICKICNVDNLLGPTVRCYTNIRVFRGIGEQSIHSFYVERHFMRTVLAIIAASFIFGLVAAISVAADTDGTTPAPQQASITGILIDQMCGAKMMKKDDPEKAATGHSKSCAVKCEGSGYAVISGKEMIKFDDNGNKLAKDFLTKTDKTKDLRVTVAGTRTGDTIAVTSLTAADSQ